MRPRNEQGAGKLAGIFWLLLFIALIYAGINLAPVYVSNYNFEDKMNQICRLGRGTHTDEKIIDLLVLAGKEYDLDDYIKRDTCKVRTTESSRTISCYYERDAKYLPGVAPRRFKFDLKVDQPILF